jgi:ATP sulfurylase
MMRCASLAHMSVCEIDSQCAEVVSGTQLSWSLVEGEHFPEVFQCLWVVHSFLDMYQ